MENDRPQPLQRLHVSILHQQFVPLDLDRFLDQLPRSAPDQILQRQSHLRLLG